MGKLVSGIWHDVWYETGATRGAFVRDASVFRNKVTADGSSGFRAEAGRYHLYIARACPWAHRTAILRALKGLEEAISISIVHPLMLDHGWTFDDYPGTVPDTVTGAKYLYEVYTRARPDYSGRATVPVLWDKREKTIVNNESSDIVRMLNREFDAFATREQPDFYPADLAAEIDALNDVIYHTVNDGVYKRAASPRPSALRGGLRRALRDARRAGAAALEPQVPLRRPADRGRLAPVHDAAALRCGLLRPLQVQPAASDGLPEAMALCARAVRGAGRRRDDQLRPHQASLLSAATAPSTRRASCPRARRSHGTRRRSGEVEARRRASRLLAGETAERPEPGGDVAARAAGVADAAAARASMGPLWLHEQVPAGSRS